MRATLLLVATAALRLPVLDVLCCAGCVRGGRRREDYLWTWIGGRGCGVVAAVVVLPVTDSFAALRPVWLRARVGCGEGEEAAQGKRRDYPSSFPYIGRGRISWDYRSCGQWSKARCRAWRSAMFVHHGKFSLVFVHSFLLGITLSLCGPSSQASLDLCLN